jgi:DCN1-like protein 1/2
MRGKGKAVSRDTWVLFIDFLRSIDADFKEHDEEGESARMGQGFSADCLVAAWPSTIDAFVEFAREKKGTA